ncbi:PspC domain protein [Corynebacterium occultum]|uniref:PspC domain protein n=2 Tax=Corynebacterium occultum TaxID=2675219 RepID=A0A6B8W6H5_9CORY|nr:PspC domain protein [Corynebacterium occultum]
MQMWETRPARIPKEQGGQGHIAGVCEGIAVRYQIDPLILRIVFVVLAFFGGGIAAYLAAWALMPRYSVPVSPIQALFKSGYPKEREQGWWLLIFFILFSGVLGAGIGEFFGSTTLLALLLSGLGWWALHKKEPVPPAGLLVTHHSETQEAPMNTTPQPDLSGITPAEGYPYPPGRSTPPAWDPLGTAPFAWDLPDPAPVVVEKKRSRLWPWMILGFGALVSTTVVIGGVITFSEGYDGGAVGDTHHSPSSIESGNHQFSGGIGDTTIDLRNLNDVQEGQEITIEGFIGDLDVRLPDNIPVQLSCENGLGDSNCTPGLYNEDAEGELLLVHVEAGIGDTDIDWG